MNANTYGVANADTKRVPYNKTLVEKEEYHTLLGQILTTVEQSGCLDYIEASNKATDSHTGWGLLYHLLNNNETGVFRGFDGKNRIVGGKQPVSRQKDNILLLLSACKKQVDHLNTTGNTIPTVVAKGASLHIAYEMLKQENDKAKKAKKKRKQEQEAAMNKLEQHWGLQASVSMAQPAQDRPPSDLSRQPQCVSLLEEATTNTSSPSATAATTTSLQTSASTRQLGSAELPSNRNSEIVNNMVVHPLDQIRSEQLQSAQQQSIMAPNFNLLCTFKKQIDSMMQAACVPATHGVVATEDVGIEEKQAAKLESKICQLRRLEDGMDDEVIKGKYRAKRHKLEMELYELL